jgi:hypothetical protein
VIGALALLHLFWLTKDGYAEAVLMLMCYLLMMGDRLVARQGRSRSH